MLVAASAAAAEVGSVRMALATDAEARRTASAATSTRVVSLAMDDIYFLGSVLVLGGGGGGGGGEGGGGAVFKADEGR